MCLDNEEWCKIWRGIGLSFQNWHEEFDEFWPKNLKVSKIFILMCSFWAKYIIFQLKRYRGVMLDCTQDWHKVWKKTGLCFQKLTWGIWQIFTRALESLWIGTLMAYFCPRKCMSLKFTGDFYVMTVKNDAKFEEELDCQFKIDMRNLTNFDPSTRKSQKLAR